MGEGTAILLGTFGITGLLVGFIRWRITRVSRKILRFLGAAKKEEVAITTGTKFSPVHEVDALRALEPGLTALNVTVTRVGLNAMGTALDGALTFGSMLNDTFQGGFGTLYRTQKEIGPDKTADLFSGALCLCERDGQKAAVMLMRGENIFAPQMNFELAVADRPDARAFGAKLLDELETWMFKSSVYRGHALVPSTDPMGALKLDFADVTLPPGIVFEDRLREDLELNFLAFVKHREELAKMGIPARRGLLLLGPPGSGKTSTCRFLRTELPGHTFFVVPSEGVAQVRPLFELARTLAPSVVVIEDVDLAMRTPDPALPNPLMKDLLNELDGLQDREDVMVVLTSNSRLQLEQALADRPGRIDHTIRYEPPGPIHRRNVLASYVKDMKTLISLDELTQLCDGLTPAQMFELVKKAAIRAIRRASANGAEPEVSSLDFRAALEELNAARGVKESRVRPFPVQ